MESSFITSPTITKIATAMVAFQGAVGSIKREANNPHFKKSYASLSNILDNIQLPLAEAGLMFSQHPDIDNSLTTIVVHAESGEFFRSSYRMKPSMDNPQGIGSTITYMRRYALGAVLGLNIEDDDDGNAGSQAPARQQAVPARPAAPAVLLSDAIAAMKAAADMPSLKAVFTKYKQFHTEPTFVAAKDARKAKLEMPTEA
jgi:hypothetical protein